MARLSMDRRARSNSRGQILPLFALLLTAMLLMSSLVLDASSALLLRRQYQSAADAAAMAAVNVSLFVGNHCAASLVAAKTAATNSVALNLPGYTGTVGVTCPTAAPYANIAVQVTLSGSSPGFFSRVVGINSFAVSTTATAVNGQIIGPAYSVVVLDPGPPTTSTGCPSVLFHGNLTAQFEGSLSVNSSCTSGPNQALNADGNSGSITFVPGAGASVVGGYVDIHHLFVVPPTTGAQPNPDPLSWLPTPGVPTTLGTSTNCTGSTSDKIYHPGNYPTGIQVSTSDRAFLMPGLYYLSNTPAKGGLQVTSSAQLYAVNSGFTPADCKAAAWPSVAGSAAADAANALKWGANCTIVGGCGVLFVNAAENNKGDISVAGGATTMVLPYQPSALVPPGVTVYKNVLIWQLGLPYYQPVISLQGGGAAYLTGGLYAPRAKISMSGGSGGSGGNLTIQFVSYDLELGGNPTFHFVYRDELLPHPLGYGLVK
jgi:hypothetical protein